MRVQKGTAVQLTHPETSHIAKGDVGQVTGTFSEHKVQVRYSVNIDSCDLWLRFTRWCKGCHTRNESSTGLPGTRGHGICTFLTVPIQHVPSRIDAMKL